MNEHRRCPDTSSRHLLPTALPTLFLAEANHGIQPLLYSALSTIPLRPWGIEQASGTPRSCNLQNQLMWHQSGNRATLQNLTKLFVEMSPAFPPLSTTAPPLCTNRASSTREDPCSTVCHHLPVPSLKWYPRNTPNCMGCLGVGSVKHGARLSWHPKSETACQAHSAPKNRPRRTRTKFPSKKFHHTEPHTGTGTKFRSRSCKAFRSGPIHATLSLTLARDNPQRPPNAASENVPTIHPAARDDPRSGINSGESTKRTVPTKSHLNGLRNLHHSIKHCLTNHPSQSRHSLHSLPSAPFLSTAKCVCQLAHHSCR